MAEFVLRHRLDKRDVFVESAGLGALSGRPIDPLAEAMLVEHGLTAKTHVARQITRQMVERAGLILVMEQLHLTAIRSLSPQASSKTFLLGQWHERVEIPDPYGQPRCVFRDVYWMIDKVADSWCQRLYTRASQS